MVTKRDIKFKPEALLAIVLHWLQDDQPRAAVLLLLKHGPLDTHAVDARERMAPSLDAVGFPATEITGPELLAFLQTAVRLRGVRGDGPAGLATSSALASQPGALIVHRVATDARGDVTHQVDAPTREAAILQWVALLSLVGLRHVRPCAAPDCSKLLVKVYRREFCSIQCQKRTKKRAERQAARDQREKQQARARRRRATTGVN